MGGGVGEQNAPLTSSMISEAQPQEEKHMLGERLWPFISAMRPETAGEIITLMLEQLDNSEILPLLDSNEALTAKVLQIEQRQMLGHRLYPLILAMDPEKATKITGMLLENDYSEVLEMLDSTELLHAKVFTIILVFAL